jgi:hypothetical protein
VRKHHEQDAKRLLLKLESYRVLSQLACSDLQFKGAKPHETIARHPRLNRIASVTPVEAQWLFARRVS